MSNWLMVEASVVISWSWKEHGENKEEISRAG